MTDLGRPEHSRLPTERLAHSIDPPSLTPLAFPMLRLASQDAYRHPLERVFDWGELNDDGHDPIERTVQAARCMDCGTPFCQTHTGCPISNIIPEFNNLVFEDQWKVLTLHPAP